ncbi:DUF3482 domain-containing protein [Betaproteobacteria bacterium PRO7]|jgi:hypothetical protein|nr:DUF3482 domain-containing protein [Betaproteobacteria bacterium PRO7]
MTDAPQTIALALVSHTNVGKTTLARTLLGRDIGEVRDAPHVTERAERYTLLETAEGDALLLVDTPGFGDSVRLAKRLAQAGNPIGWFLAEVWDRFRDRPFWSTQQAVRAVLEHADVVLYLVNAAESPEQAGYLAPEIRVLALIGKPVLVLLNQLGAPRPREEEDAEVERWRRHFATTPIVRAVIALDAFARCWVQESALLALVEAALPESRRAAFARLRAEWLARRRSRFERSMQVLAERIARAALDREPVEDVGLKQRLREVGAALGVAREGEETPQQQAMRRLAERLAADIRASTDRLIALHDLAGQASDEVLARLTEHYAVKQRVSEGKAAVIGGMVTGALTGLKADLATGGLSFGAGLLAGGLLGALGAAGLARGYNLVRDLDTSSVAWSDEALHDLAINALLGYLAVAHYGRGRGDWKQSESPPFWRDLAVAAVEARRDDFAAVWSTRAKADAPALADALRPLLAACAREVLGKLYPDATQALG